MTLKTKLRLRRALLHVQWLGEAAAIYLVMGLCRLLGRDKASALGGFVARAIGPRLTVSRIARDQIARALPDLTPAQGEAVLLGNWDNLGRYFTEYPHLQTMWPDRPEGPLPTDPVIVSPEVVQRFLDLRDDGLPAILFTAHIGNWELLPVGAARYRLPLAAIFRRPNNPIAERLLLRIRGRMMGELIPTNFHAALAAARVLERGGHLGMLVDQHFSRGVRVPFFGREARTAITLAKLARRFRCPVHGAWAERLDGARFRIHLTPALDLERHYDDPDEQRALAAITAAVTAEVEGWVRSRPELWNWLHRRWR